MGDKNRIQLAGADAKALQPFLRPLSAYSNIHQNVRRIRCLLYTSMPHVTATGPASAAAFTMPSVVHLTGCVLSVLSIPDSL